MTQKSTVARQGLNGFLVGLATPDFSSVAWRNLLSEIKARRWHFEVHRAARELPAVLDPRYLQLCTWWWTTLAAPMTKVG